MGDVSVARIIISRAALALALSRAPRLDRLLVFWLGFSLSIERARRSNFIDRTAAVHRDRRSVHRYSMAGHANPTRHLGRLRVHAPPPTLTSSRARKKKENPVPPRLRLPHRLRRWPVPAAPTASATPAPAAARRSATRAAAPSARATRARARARTGATRATSK